MAEPPTSRLNILEQVLKLSSLVLVTAYVSGYLMELGYLAHLPPVFYDVDFSPRILINGAEVMLVFAGIPTLGTASFFVTEFMDKWLTKKLGRSSSVGRGTRYFFVILGPLLAVSITRDVLHHPAFYLQAEIFVGNFLLCLLVVFPTAYSRLTRLQRYAAIAIIATVLYDFSFAAGGTNWNTAFGQGVVRLLVAPEATSSAKELGLLFPSAENPHLSESVVMLYVGSRTYIFQTKSGNRLVQLTKDKVWGITP